jgi:chromosome segregation ATPase
MSEEFANSKLADMEAEADRLHAELYAQKEESETPQQESEAAAVEEVIEKDTVDEEAQPESEAEQPQADETGNDETEQTEAEAEQDAKPADDDQLTIQNAEKRIKDAQRRMTKATQETASLRRENDTLRQRVTDLAGEVATLKTQVMAPAATDADLARLTEEYPDLAKPLLGQIHRLQSELEGFKSQANEMRNHSQVDAQERAKLEHQNAILAVHPDAFEVAQTESFREWLDAQPSYMRQVVEKGSSEDVVDLLNSYKDTLAKPKQVTQTLEQAREIAEPKTRSTKPKPEGRKNWSRAEIDAMSPTEYLKHELEIDQALKEGRVI